jgi:periplasmic mercuric ion binding protein
MNIGGQIMIRIVICGVLIGFAYITAMPVFAGEQKVILMIGGQYCDLYLGDVETALKKKQGIKAVDFKSMKGHVMVTIDSEKVKADQLAAAVNGVKGDGWHCTAEVMK